LPSLKYASLSGVCLSDLANARPQNLTELRLVHSKFCDPAHSVYVPALHPLTIDAAYSVKCLVAPVLERLMTIRSFAPGHL
jgi:hypothetical protein